MSRHLKAEEFVDLLDGVELAEKRAEHAAHCVECRAALVSVSELHQDIAEFETADFNADLPNIDWTELRSSVRDRLLSRSVKRSSAFRRWTGWALTPAAAWSLTLALLVSGMTVGGVWHYQTAHGIDNGIGSIRAPGSSGTLIESEDDSGFFLDDPETIEAEALAWSGTEIFTILNELEAGEEEVLRELVTLAFAGDSIFDEGVR